MNLRNLAIFDTQPSVKFATQIGMRYFLSRLEEEKLMKAGRLVSVPDPFIAYKLLLSGRIQAFFTSPVVHAHQLKNLPSFEGHYRGGDFLS